MHNSAWRATAFHSHQARDILLRMAQVWLRLAENYEEAEVVGRTKAAEEARPVIQQQQQIRPKKGDL
jgi:hypothetical protein